jgi:hypothetical protein
VNDELGALKEMLEQLPLILKKGGPRCHHHFPFSWKTGW